MRIQVQAHVPAQSRAKGILVRVFTAALAASTAVAAAAQSSLPGNSLDGPTSPAQSNAVTDRYLTSVQAELTVRVDAKNATVGQEIDARTTETAKLADYTTLPKGTKLVGHITSLLAPDRNSGRAGSLLAITFDHAELKTGQIVTLRCVMQAIGPSAPVSMRGDTMGSVSNQPMTTGVPVPSSVGGGLGGAAGGGLDGPVRGTGQSAGSIGRPSGRAVGAPIADTTATHDSGSRTPGGEVVAAGEILSTAPRATALPGVMLSTASTGASGTLIAPGSDISLQSGTLITLGVIAR